MKLNRTRLAISAGVIGAIASTAWTGSWREVPTTMTAFHDARCLQAENNFYAAMKTTREAYQHAEMERCLEYKRSNQYKIDLQAAKNNPTTDLFGLSHTIDPADVSANCAVFRGEGIFLCKPEESLESYQAGIAASLGVLAPLALSMSVGALIATLLMALGPSVVRGYFRWLQSS